MRYPRRPPSWFVLALVVLFLVQLAVNAIRPMVSYRALALGAGTVDLGIIAASFALLSFVLAIPVGRLIDRRGESVFILAGVAVITVVSLALVVAASVLALAATQALLGLGQVLSVIGLQSLIANSEPATRDARFSTFTVVVSLGQLVGPAVAGFLGQHVPAGDPSGVGTSVFIVGAASGVAGCALALGLLRAAPGRRTSAETTTEPSRLRGTMLRVLRLPNIPHAMFASVAVLTTTDLLVAYLPAYGKAAGLSVATVGLLLSTRAAASMVARAFLVVLIRGVGRGRLLVACTLVPAAALSLLPVLGTIPASFALMGLAGLGLGLGQPLSLSWVARAAPAEIRGTAIAVRLSGNRLGQVLIPAAIGGIVGATGITALFWAVAVMLVGSSALTASGTFDEPG